MKLISLTALGQHRVKKIQYGPHIQEAKISSSLKLQLHAIIQHSNPDLIGLNSTIKEHRTLI